MPGFRWIPALVGVLFGASVGVAASCGGGTSYENPSFRCAPVDGLCSDGYRCCSDDPAALGGLLPGFDGAGGEGFGTPLFSGANNPLGTQGMCVQEGSIAVGLAGGCPTPCNPTWAADQIEQVCGAGLFCCQTQAVDPERDCVVDPESGRWRTVRGEDIFAAPQLTMWAADEHGTHQDPGGEGCRAFAAGDDSLAQACYRELTVADQRGFCDSRVCNCVEDPCELLNPDAVPRCP